MDRLVLFSIVAVGAGCRTSADCDAGVTFCDGYTGVCWSCSFVELLVPTGLETQSSCPHHAVIVRTSHRTTPISKGPFQTPELLRHTTTLRSPMAVSCLCNHYADRV